MSGSAEFFAPIYGAEVSNQAVVATAAIKGNTRIIETILLILRSFSSSYNGVMCIFLLPLIVEFHETYFL